MKSVDFLDAVRDQHGLTSDNKAAQFLDIPQGTIAGIRTGRRKWTGEECTRIEEAMDYPEGYVLAEVQAERQTDRKLSKVWRNVAAGILKSAKGKAHALGLAVLLSIMANLTMVDARAEGFQSVTADNFSSRSIHYAHVWCRTKVVMSSFSVGIPES